MKWDSRKLREGSWTRMMVNNGEEVTVNVVFAGRRFVVIDWGV